jgi:hypothetical protein
VRSGTDEEDELIEEETGFDELMIPPDLSKSQFHQV